MMIATAEPMFGTQLNILYDTNGYDRGLIS